MVFQRPNPFPKSIYDNIAFALRVLGMKDDLNGRVERALRKAALWDEVKDRLKESALGLSGGQQQRLCIARAIAVEPEVVLFDEPCSALDPISTSAIEDLMHELKREYTLVIVTHNMQQAARVAEMTAFFSLDEVNGRQTGTLIEFDATSRIFTNPADSRTERLRHRPLRLARSAGRGSQASPRAGTPAPRAIGERERERAGSRAARRTLRGMCRRSSGITDGSVDRVAEFLPPAAAAAVRAAHDVPLRGRPVRRRSRVDEHPAPRRFELVADLP